MQVPDRHQGNQYLDQGDSEIEALRRRFYDSGRSLQAGDTIDPPSFLGLLAKRCRPMSLTKKRAWIDT